MEIWGCYIDKSGGVRGSQSDGYGCGSNRPRRQRARSGRHIGVMPRDEMGCRRNSGSQLDSDVPPAPNYVLGIAGQGNITLSQVGFATLTNTRSVTAGTLQLIYFDELQMPTGYWLSGSIDTAIGSLMLNAGIAWQTLVGLQIGSEILTLTNFDATSNTCTVVRGQFGTAAAPHTDHDAVFLLQQKTFVAPFARDFFGNPASQNFAHTIIVPDVRIVSSQFVVTNSRGNSRSANQSYLDQGTPGGLRTCSGRSVCDPGWWLSGHTAECSAAADGRSFTCCQGCESEHNRSATRNADNPTTLARVDSIHDPHHSGGTDDVKHRGRDDSGDARSGFDAAA